MPNFTHNFMSMKIYHIFAWSKAHRVNNFLIIADVRLAVRNKVPLVRSLTLNWVTFCIETSNKAAVLKLHKDYVPICMEVGKE